MKRKVCIGIAAVLCVLCLGTVLLSYGVFGTGNIFRVSAAYGAIASGKAKYVQISDDPRIVLAAPDNAMALLKSTLEKEGYTFAEDRQMGSMLTVSRDGKAEQLHFSVNGFYALWKWK